MVSRFYKPELDALQFVFSTAPLHIRYEDFESAKSAGAPLIVLRWSTLDYFETTFQLQERFFQPLV
jgi:hypothetical protein